MRVFFWLWLLVVCLLAGGMYVVMVVSLRVVERCDDVRRAGDVLMVWQILFGRRLWRIYCWLRRQRAPPTPRMLAITVVSNINTLDLANYQLH